MADKEAHPRNETQADREAASLELTKLIKRTVFRHGTEYLTPDTTAGDKDVSTSVAFWRTLSGQLLEMIILRGNSPESGNFTLVQLIKMKNAGTDLFGPQEHYVSQDGEPFKRSDLDGHALGLPTLTDLVEATRNPGQTMNLALLNQSLDKMAGVLVTAKVANEREGIDGFPISAVEARGLVQEIEQGDFVI